MVWLRQRWGWRISFNCVQLHSLWWSDDSFSVELYVMCAVSSRIQSSPTHQHRTNDIYKIQQCLPPETAVTVYFSIDLTVNSFHLNYLCQRNSPWHRKWNYSVLQAGPELLLRTPRLHLIISLGKWGCNEIKKSLHSPLAHTLHK